MNAQTNSTLAGCCKRIRHFAGRRTLAVALLLAAVIGVAFPGEALAQMDRGDWWQNDPGYERHGDGSGRMLAVLLGLAFLGIPVILLLGWLANIPERRRAHRRQEAEKQW